MPKPSNEELRDKYVSKATVVREKLADLREAYNKFQTTYQPGTPLQLEVTDKGYRQLIGEKESQLKDCNKQVKKFNLLLEIDANQ